MIFNCPTTLYHWSERIPKSQWLSWSLSVSDVVDTRTVFSSWSLDGPLRQVLENSGSKLMIRLLRRTCMTLYWGKCFLTYISIKMLHHTRSLQIFNSCYLLNNHFRERVAKNYKKEIVESCICSQNTWELSINSWAILMQVCILVWWANVTQPAYFFRDRHESAAH